MEKCPWCNNEAVAVNSPLGWFVECRENGHIHNIGVFGHEHSFHDTKDEAMDEWNKQVRMLKQEQIET